MMKGCVKTQLFIYLSKFDRLLHRFVIYYVLANDNRTLIITKGGKNNGEFNLLLYRSQIAVFAVPP